jgi:predicted unusual protein kinase regulating ubiquinone biosynthesis (AarF/ABC1/UbiB family)
MAESMVKIGMTNREVNLDALCRDLETIHGKVATVDPEHVLNGAVNDNEINRIMLDMVAVGERHGIRFPRAFALLLKQILYFDRYVKILAPEMNVFADDRIDLMGEMQVPRLLH